MVSAATHAYLVVRRHVDLGRTRSMICWHSLNPRRPVRPPRAAQPIARGPQRSRTSPCPTCAFQSQPPRHTEMPAPQARRGPVVARLRRAAEQERAVQEGRRPAQRPRPDPAHLLQARLRLDRPGRPARPLPLDGALHPAQARASTAARPRCSRRRSSTTASSCCGSAPTARCSRPTPSARSARIGTDFARDTADVTDRENIQYHWIRIEDVPAIWERLDAAGLSSIEACGDSPRPFLGSPVAGVAKDEIIDGTAALDEIFAPLHRQPGLLQPPAQVQDRADRPPQPRRLARDQRRRRSSAPSTPSTAPASTSGSAAACRPTRCSPRSSASGSRSTRWPTSGRASRRSSATTATGGCARGPG